MAPTVTPTRNINLAVMSVDPRRPWIAGGSMGNGVIRASAFRVRRPVTVSTVSFHVNTQSGNVDIGIYKDNGDGTWSRVASTGSFACPAAGVQSQALSSSVVLVPGIRYAAAASGDTAAQIYGIPNNITSSTQLASKAMWALLTGGFPLPSSATPNSGTSLVHFLVFS